MSQIDVRSHVIYKLRNAKVNLWPFPHFYAEEVFPIDFYWKLCDQIRRKTDFSANGNLYKGRQFSGMAGVDGIEFMKEPEFLRDIAQIFGHRINRRATATVANGQEFGLTYDLRLVRDGQGYSIGPHTDAPWKVVSLLFYMPVDGWHGRDGTSIYVPKDPLRTFGPGHHKFDDFHQVFTAPYLPNTCFGFFKTEDSFHGVPPIEEDYQRDVLLYNIYQADLHSKKSEPEPDAP